MNQSVTRIRPSVVCAMVIADSFCFLSIAHAAGPDNPVSLSITPRYMYRPPAIVGISSEPVEPAPASGVDDWANRQTPALEKPDNWACRTSNNLSRSSIGRNPDGKSISDIQGLLPKC